MVAVVQFFLDKKVVSPLAGKVCSKFLLVICNCPEGGTVQDTKSNISGTQCYAQFPINNVLKWLIDYNFGNTTPYVIVFLFYCVYVHQTGH